MPAINIAYLELRLSGGAANTDPNASLGGEHSSERVLSQSTTALVNVAGVVIDYAAGNAEGVGVLEFFAADQSFVWTPFGATAGDPVIATEDARIAIRGSEGLIMITVTFASLSSDDESDSVTIANIANETFDDVAKLDSFNGDTEYRCVYAKNAHGVDPFFDAVVYIGALPTPGSMEIGLDPVGPGDGIERSVTGIARSGATATATTSGAHGFSAGFKVRVRGADQTEYNGVFIITNPTGTTFDYTVSGTPTTPATGTMVCGWGMAALVLSEDVAPSGVTFVQPLDSTSGLSLGQMDTGNVSAFWMKRIIPVRSTTANPESTSLFALQSFF